MTDTLALLATLVALLLGLAVGKAWERYKLREGRWFDRRKVRESPHYILGLQLLVSNQVDLAIEELAKAAALDPAALEIHLILGNLYRERGQVSKAVRLHRRLLQHSRLGRTEQTYVQLSLGLDYKQGGFVDRAFQAFSEVTRLDPDNKYALLNLERLHAEQQQWREARAIRRRLTDIADEPRKPRDQAILAFLENELGLQAVRRGEPQEAAAHFRSALDLDDGTVPASLNLGDVYMRSGRPREAIAVWEQILEKAPERAYLTFDRLKTAYTEVDGPARFVALCRRLIEDNPQDWRARLALGRHAMDEGDPARALDLLLESLGQNPHALAVHQLIWRALSTLEFRPTPVRRYLTLTRNAVFYLDPHVCTRCRYRSTELLWQCPQCHEWNTFVEERLPQAENVEGTPA
ncbi:MAG: tetratricopeptide repeat protein [Acidobacteria bacterium]|nr:tetratricopeptide repeat protein [Acidobacteriota bacterium]